MASDRVEAGAANAILFEDIFEVIALNPEGKKFDRGVVLCHFEVI
jgi:hypothetical protein